MSAKKPTVAELSQELAHLYSAFLRGFPITDEAGLRKRMLALFKSAGVRACRVCGCTEVTACEDLPGEACRWVSKDLCSACVRKQPPPTPKQHRPRGAR